MSDFKTCSKCNESKAITEFYYHRQRKTYSSSCKLCNNKQCLKFQNESGYRDTEKYVFYQRAYEIKRRCKQKGIECDSDIRQQLERLWNNSKNCDYTGVEMTISGYQHNNYAMTVDRKNPALGYVEGNIVLCSSMANRMKQNMTPNELVNWCQLILSHLNKGN